MGLMDLIERGFSEVNSTAFRQVNRVAEWWQLPLPAALLNLRAYRDDMRKMNLYDTRAPGNGDQAEEVLDKLPKHRTYDGSLQDPNDPEMGQVGTRFGRNTPSDVQPEQMPELMTPSPREVSQKLLYRDSFKPARDAQRARGVLDPVREPRLVRPRREQPEGVHRRPDRPRTTSGPMATR